MSEDIIGPSLNCALVNAVSPSDMLGPKATGVLIALEDDLFLLTNWHVATGRRWHAGQRPGVTSEESTELKRLKRENAELERANSILKSAPAFFAAELDRPLH